MASEPGFPQHMVHPQHKPAVLAKFDSSVAVPGAPERFPPVEVHSADQEEMLRARGYLRYGEAMPKVVAFSEYPKTLVHPQHAPAVPASKAASMVNGQLVQIDIPGKPAVHPDVIVRDEDEELEWLDKGWREPGRSDEIAFERATLAPGKPGEEWPKWIDGVLTQDPDAPADLTKDYPKWLHFDDGTSVLVNDPAHEQRVMVARETGPPEVEPAASKPYVPLQSEPHVDPEYAQFLAWKAAKAAQDAQAAQSSEDERAALLAQAEERGIEVDGRWGVRRLREALASEEAAAE